MSDLRGLGDVVAHRVVPPSLSTLEGVARSRRQVRRAFAGAAGAVAVAGLLLVWTPGRDASAPATSTTQNESAAAELAAADIVGHPRAVVMEQFEASDPDIRVRSVPASDRGGRLEIWGRCVAETREDCWRDPAAPAVAVRATSDDGRQALARVGNGGFDVRYVGNGTFYVGGDRGGLLLGPTLRQPRPLVVTAGLAPPRQDMEVVGCPSAAAGPSRLCALDVASARLTQLDVPPGVAWMAPYRAGSLWGVSPAVGRSRVVVWQGGRGDFREHDPGFPVLSSLLMIGGLDPGVMAMYVGLYADYSALHFDPEVLLISTDGGTTWHSLGVPPGAAVGDRSGFVLPADWRSWEPYQP